MCANRTRLCDECNIDAVAALCVVQLTAHLATAPILCNTSTLCCIARDQWFTSDLTSRAVKRIEDVRELRSRYAVLACCCLHALRDSSA
jgi:hypothetical protein